MFSNRFTALIDACSLAGALERNLMLTLAKAEFFRLRWSRPILNETETAIRRIMEHRGDADSAGRASRACRVMEQAFEDAMVEGFEPFLPACAGLPDPGDAHVVAAAMKTRAAVIVTENVRHFPPELLTRLNLEARGADIFIADTIALDEARAVVAVRSMRERLKKPELTADDLLTKMEARGLTEAVDVLRPYRDSL